MTSANFRKSRIEIFNKQQLKVEIEAIKNLIAKLEQENVEKFQLLEELREELQEKESRLREID